MSLVEMRKIEKLIEEYKSVQLEEETKLEAAKEHKDEDSLNGRRDGGPEEANDHPMGDEAKDDTPPPHYPPPPSPPHWTAFLERHDLDGPNNALEDNEDDSDSDSDGDGSKDLDANPEDETAALAAVLFNEGGDTDEEKPNDANPASGSNDVQKNSNQEVKNKSKKEPKSNKSKKSSTIYNLHTVLTIRHAGELNVVVVRKKRGGKIKQGVTFLPKCKNFTVKLPAKTVPRNAFNKGIMKELLDNKPHYV